MLSFRLAFGIIAIVVSNSLQANNSVIEDPSKLLPSQIQIKEYASYKNWKKTAGMFKEEGGVSAEYTLSICLAHPTDGTQNILRRILVEVVHSYPN